MIKRLFFSLFLLLSISGFCKPPSLSPKDTSHKIEEILKAHVSYQRLTPEIMQRALFNFIEELDPGKTYFLESEVEQWTNASPELLSLAIEGAKKDDFGIFQKVHEQMFEAIQRRNQLEDGLQEATLPQEVKASDLKDLSFAKTEEELKERLLKIRALQGEAMSKLSADDADQLNKRLQKRRLKREEEIAPEQANERQQFMLSIVLKAVSSALDSQTNYFTPSEASQFMIQVEQRLYGIGAQLRDDLNGFTILRLLEGGPALLSNKVKIGDKIIAVNHEPVVGMDIVEAVEHIRGREGSVVTLTILRPQSGESKEEILEVDITRAEVVLKETRLEKKLESFGDGGLAYLHLFSFYQDSATSSAEDLRQALEEMQKSKKIKGVILDLRNNAGGLLPQAVAVTGLFIDKGVVVSVKDNTGFIQHLRNLEEKPAWKGPLIVLVNRLSASAAEIVAQTLQEYGRAIVIGDEKTYGKGTFQTFTLESNHYGKINPKGEYKVTRGCYYTVSGKSPQLVGVHSEIVVPGPFSKLKIGEEFSKYPLANETIPENFHDDLSDIPPFHRFRFGKNYRDNLQTVLTTYQKYLPLLKKNSEDRITSNLPYQKFLKDIEDEDAAYEFFEAFSHSDLQLLETYNVMKDLLFLMTEEEDSLALAS